MISVRRVQTTRLSETEDLVTTFLVSDELNSEKEEETAKFEIFKFLSENYHLLLSGNVLYEDLRVYVEQNRLVVRITSTVKCPATT